MERTKIVTRALKNQLTNVFHASYISDLHDNYTGYKTITIQEILQHLYESYGDLDENYLEANEKILTQEFNIAEPSSVFVKRIEDCMDIAEAAGAPCTDAQLPIKFSASS